MKCILLMVIRFIVDRYIPLSPQCPSDIRIPEKNVFVYMWRDSFLSVALIVSQHFMEPKDSLPNSQELSTCPYPEPDQCS
jgi:hypothetical protein